MHQVNTNGANIPAIGLGTWTLEGEAGARLVAHALESGYRHIDTAAFYNNEEAVGEGIRASGVARDSIFLTTKIWFTELADGDLQRSLEASLKRLDMDAVDLALIHWPSKVVPMAETIGALNTALDSGMARNIGVSNFTTGQIESAVAASRNPLACNQVEYHPYLNQDRVLEACRKHGMALVSYCPLGRGGDLFAESAVTDAAERHGKTPAQVVLRWHVQQEGVVAIPRSQNPERIRQNLDVFDFALAADEVAAIDSLRARGHRICDFEFSPAWDAA